MSGRVQGWLGQRSATERMRERLASTYSRLRWLYLCITLANSAMVLGEAT